jgi:predicted PurR-regulated permease PerM
MDLQRWIRTTCILLTTTLCLWLLYVAKAVFMPLALAGMLAVVFTPLCRWLERRMPVIAAALVCGLVFTGVIGAILLLVGWHVGKITSDLNDIRQHFGDFIGKLHTLAQHWDLPLPKDGSGFLDPATVGRVTATLLGVLINLVLLLVYMIMLLTMRTHIRTFFLKLGRPGTNALLDRSVGIIRQYLYGMLVIIACLWIMYGVAFSLIGVHYALFFAILCGVLELIPFVGNITGNTLTCIMAFTQGGGVPMVVEIIGAYLLIQGIQFYIISPLVMRHQVNIHPLFTIVVLIAGDLLWGIPGMILAIPALGIAKILLDQSQDFKALGYLLGKAPKTKPGVPG